MTQDSEGNVCHNFSEKLKPSYSSYEQREKQLAACREYYRKNKELVKERAKHVSDEVKSRKKERTRKWKAANRAKVNANQNRWLAENRDRVAKYRKTQAEKPENKISRNLRRRLREFMGVLKNRPSLMFGCTSAELRKHIQSQFKKGMSWKNYGKWHVDHIVPCAAFDLTNKEHVKICFNWQNLRPLWADENMKKSDKNTHPQVFLPLQIK